MTSKHAPAWQRPGRPTYDPRTGRRVPGVTTLAYACGTTCPLNLAPPRRPTMTNCHDFWVAYLEPDACPTCAIRAGLGKRYPGIVNCTSILAAALKVDDYAAEGEDDGTKYVGWGWRKVEGASRYTIPPRPPFPWVRLAWSRKREALQDWGKPWWRWRPDPAPDPPCKWDALVAREPSRPDYYEGLLPLATWLYLVAHNEWPLGMTFRLSVTGGPSPIGRTSWPSPTLDDEDALVLLNSKDDSTISDNVTWDEYAAVHSSASTKDWMVTQVGLSDTGSADDFVQQATVSQLTKQLGDEWVVKYNKLVGRRERRVRLYGADVAAGLDLDPSTLDGKLARAAKQRIINQRKGGKR